MPELPEVETVAEGLRQRILGRRIASLEIRHTGIIHGSPEEFVAGHRGAQLLPRVAHGQIDLHRVDGGEKPRASLVCFFRLGMTGQITFSARSEPIESHTHVIFLFDDGN